MKRHLLIGSIALLLAIACEHQPVIRPDQTGNTDTTGNGGGSGGGGGGGGGGTSGGIKCSPDTVYFVNEILPLLRSNCAQSGCHDATTRREGVRLDNYNDIIRTGEVRAGRPDNSELFEMITEDDNDDRMPPPPKPRLPQDAIEKIRKWIQQGARNNYCTGDCDTGRFAWSNDISPIISRNCVACHSAGNVLLNSYSGVRTVALNGRLMGALLHKSGFQPMPMGGRLSDCDLTRIQKWVDNGAPEN